jgi:hypothetical protein
VNGTRRQRRSTVALTLLLGSAVAGAGCEDKAGALPGPESAGAGTASPGGSGPTAASGAGAGGAGASGRGGTGGVSSGGSEGSPGVGGLQGGAGGAGGAAAVGEECEPDTDFDGTPDCLDGCPTDASKLAVGVCGCGVPDFDTDFDGTIDCEDMCPADFAKTQPGECGCGLSDGDSDSDGQLDCDEACPFDATRTEEGACGCGAPDDLALCLRHRYSFDGDDAVALDSAGDADGTIQNTLLDGSGVLTLDGVDSDQFVDLPDGIISRLGPSATIELWFAWTGAGGPWQRVFDFGSSEAEAGFQGGGVTYLFVTPSNTLNTHLRAAFTNAGPPQERTVNAPTALPFPLPNHIAVVIDGPAATLTLYQNGTLIETAPTVDTTLARLNDINNWIGRSQFIADEEFQGTIDEVRIYSAARSAAQIADDIAAGPDQLPDE